jgi:hypothetical protein
MIKDLPDGQYFWSVQALDNNYEGSVFAPEASFIIGTVGLDSFRINDVSVFPNPAKDQLSISNARGNKLKIINNLGVVVLDRDVAGNNIILNVSNWIEGIYYLQFSKGAERFVEKVVISR